MNKLYTILVLALLMVSINAICIENDGFMNIFFQGLTLGPLNGEFGEYEDYCNDEILNEYICAGTEAYKIELNCNDFGLYCIEGRCTFDEPPPIYQCIDSEIDIDPFTYGYILAINDEFEGMAEDFCVSDKILHEVYCEGVYTTATVINCEDYDLYCVDGACQELEPSEPTENEAPELIFASIEPIPAIAKLGCTVLVEDADDETVNVDIKWFRNNEYLPELDETRECETGESCPDLTSGLEMPEGECDKWECEAIAYDEEDYSEPYLSEMWGEWDETCEEITCDDCGDGYEVLGVGDYYETENYKVVLNDISVGVSSCADPNDHPAIVSLITSATGMIIEQTQICPYESASMGPDDEVEVSICHTVPGITLESKWACVKAVENIIELDCISDCTQITEPGYYTLCNDIEVEELPEGNKCIDIRADDVTLDCLGYKLTGIDRAGIGIYSYDVENMEIRNCEVSNWRYGFVSWYTTESTIHNNIFKNNIYGIQPYVSSNGNTIMSNQIIENKNGILLSDQNTGNNYYDNYACNNEDNDIREGEEEITRALGNYFDENTCQNTYPNDHDHYCDYYCGHENEAPEITEIVIQQEPSTPGEDENLLGCYVLIEDDNEEVDVTINWYVNDVLQEGYETEGICETGTLCDLDTIYPGNNIECTTIKCEAEANDGEYTDENSAIWENDCPDFCEDSDGGPILTIFGIGTNRTGDYEDECISETQIKEFYCEGTELRHFINNCPEGNLCIDGECVRNEESLTINLLVPENDTTVTINEGSAVPLIWEGNSMDSDSIEYSLYVSCETNMYGGKDYDLVYTGPNSLFLFNEYEDCDENIFWYVVANDGYNTEVSEEWVFNIEINYPPTIELLSPENNTGICGNYVELTWNGNDQNEDELEYTVHISNGIIELSDTTSDETYEVGPLDQGNYTWYISVSDGRFITHSEHWEFEVYDSPSITLISPPEYSWVYTGDTIYFEADNFDYKDWGWDVTELTRDSKDSRSEVFEPVVPSWLDYGEHNITIRLDNGVCSIQETFIFNVGECREDYECEYLDNTYCSGDLIVTQQGVCNSEYKCVAENTEFENCNLLNNYFCSDTWIMYEDYTCSDEIEAHCVVDQINEDTNCDNGLYCDGQETCMDIGEDIYCQAGTTIDCSGNNLESIFECNYNPDNIPTTLDYFAGFTSTCNEETDSCTTGSIEDNLEHHCSTTFCDAECNEDTPCEDTVCIDQSGCVGNDWYEYSNVPNDCLGDCSCTDNECTEYEIYENDERCVECMTDEQCAHLNNDYCAEDSIMQDEGKCVAYECTVETTEVEDCNMFDTFSCSDTWKIYEDYSCNIDTITCTIEVITPLEDCNDGLYCNGEETCEAGECQASTPVDCSGNNLAGIATCTNDPDTNPFTWDYFAGFTSTCNEETDSCTTGSIEDNLEHDCSVTLCDAECDAENECTDTYCEDLSGCVGPDYYEYTNVPNDCLGDCSCTDNECTEYEIFENDYACTNCYECEDLQLYENDGFEGEEHTLGGYTIIVDEITEDKIYFHYSYLGEYLYRGSVSVGNQITDTPHNPAAPSLLTKVCDVRNVDLENEWGCYGFELVGEITCEVDSDCSELNTNYCNGDLVMQTQGICVENVCTAETTEFENCNVYNTETCEGTSRIYSDYSCSAGECIAYDSTVIEECDNELYCDGQETCTELIDGITECQASTPVDCSENNLAGIATCTNDPDANPFTWDYFAGFTSTCNEETDSCTTGTVDLTYECSVDNCGAECDAENDCTDTYCEDLSGCVGPDYYEYTNVPNDCLGDCSCTDNECTEYIITENDARCEVVECVEPYTGMVIMEDTIFCEGTYNVDGNISVGAHNIVIEGNNTTIIGRVWYEEDTRNPEEQNIYSLKKADTRDEEDYLNGLTIKNINWINYGILTSFLNNSKIQNNTFEGYSPISGLNTINSEIINNTIIAEGIYVFNAPLAFMDSENLTIERNIIQSNTEDAGLSMGSILLLGTGNSTVNDNIIECIGEGFNDGIYVLGNDNEVISNSITGCNFGLFLNGAYNNTLEENYLCNNDVDIVLDTSTGNNIGDNTCDNIQDDSIYENNEITCSIGCVLNLLTGECIDSDEGYNIFEYGETTYLDKTETDKCRDHSSLYEYFCDINGVMRSSVEYCPVGYLCEEGECIDISQNEEYIQTKDGIEKVYHGHNKPNTYSIKPSSGSNSGTSGKTFKP